MGLLRRMSVRIRSLTDKRLAHSRQTIFYRKGGGWARLCASLAISAFVVIFLSAGGSGKADTDNLRSGQAHHAVDSVVVPAYSSSGYDSEKDAVSEMMVDQELQEAVEEVEDDIKEAEAQELRKEDTVLEAKASELGNSLRLRLGGLFSKTLTFDEMNAVATEVEHELTTEVENELRDKADEIAERDIGNIEDLIDAEEEAGVDPDEIEEDMYNQESFALKELRTDIDQAADHLKENMKVRAAEIEKEILELRLSAKLGRKIKLVIVDDEVQGLEDPRTSGYASQPQTQGHFAQSPPQTTVSSTYAYAAAQTGYGVPASQAQPAYTYGAATPADSGFESKEESDYEEENDAEQNGKIEEQVDGDESGGGGGKFGGWW